MSTAAIRSPVRRWACLVLVALALLLLVAGIEAQTTTAVVKANTSTRRTTSRSGTKSRTKTRTKTKKTTTKKRTTTSRMLIKSTGHPINLRCKSGTYQFTKDNLAIYEDEFSSKTEFIATWNGLGKNVIRNRDGSVDLKLLRPSSKFPGTNGYQGAGAVLTHRRKLPYGTVSAWIRAGPRNGAGVIMSFITMSERGDEIDWEFVMGNPTNKAQNSVEYTWYRGGVPNTVPNFWGRGGRCAPRNGRDVRTSFHKYTIKWTPTYVAWLIDDNECDRILKSDPRWSGTLPDGTRYTMFPEQPSNVQFGLWNAGGADPSIWPGTRDWAGGYTNWNDPTNAAKGFGFTIANITITCGA